MIRQAEQRDAEGLASLLRALTEEFPRIASEPPEITLKRVAEALRASDHSHTVLIAEDAGKTTGFIQVHWQPSFLRSGGEGFVSALFLHPDYRGRGLGRALLARIEDEGKRRGCSRLMLLNMRDRSSYKRSFYAKLGWNERPEAANFVFDHTGAPK